VEHMNRFTKDMLRAAARSFRFSSCPDAAGQALQVVRALARAERAKRLALREAPPECLWDFGY